MEHPSVRFYLFEHEFEVGQRSLVTDITYNTDEFFPTHQHNYNELGIIVCGEAEHICNGKTFSLGSRDAFLITVSDAHSLRLAKGTRLIIARFDNSCIRSTVLSALNASSNPIRRLSEADFKRLLIYSEHLLQEQNSDRCMSGFYVQNLIETLLITVLRYSDRSAFSPSNSPYSGYIRDAIDIVNNHYAEPISLKDTAKKLAVSPDYLGKLFKLSTGISFHGFLRKKRLKQACVLLVTTDLTVSEIADRTGFCSAEYFSSVFKAAFSRTPSEYREIRPQELFF